MTTYSFPLVGMHFRPPAKQILGALPNGTPCVLQHEPDNPYDPDAIKVLVDLADIPQMYRGGLEAALEGTGAELDDLALEPFHLGYIGKTGAKQNVKLGLPGNLELHDLAADFGCGLGDLAVELSTHMTGDPIVEVSEPPEDDEPDEESEADEDEGEADEAA